MAPLFQFAPKNIALSRKTGLGATAILLGIFLACPHFAGAQGAPRGTIGQVDGRDVTVEGGAAAREGSDDPGFENYVSNGSIVTVHAGSARMRIFSGGMVSICGPAKFTVLTSQDAITIAVNFGRVRVQLPAKTELRVFTPTIIGTPLDISGASRDVTLGLNLDDSLCVLATSGAVQLEHQFTGEKLIVPQAGEFFLNAGKLLPVAGTPGGCQCDADVPQATPTPDASSAKADFAAAPPLAPPVTDPERAPAAAAPAPDTRESVEYSVLAQGNNFPPLAQERPLGPPVTVPVYTVVLPPLIFTAGAPAPPVDKGSDLVMLIRVAQVSPDWDFSGHVSAPTFAQAVQNALGEGPASPQAPARGAGTGQAEDSPLRRKGGFWASFKRAFGG
jgi:hypothetical protein